MWNSRQVSTHSRTCDSDSKSSDWLFPTSETSVAAGRCYRLLICTRFHGSETTHSLFHEGDHGAGQMASRMHLGAAVAAAHSSTHTEQASSKQHQLTESQKRTTESSQVTLIKVFGLDWKPLIVKLIGKNVWPPATCKEKVCISSSDRTGTSTVSPVYLLTEIRQQLHYFVLEFLPNLVQHGAICPLSTRRGRDSRFCQRPLWM